MNEYIQGSRSATAEAYFLLHDAYKAKRQIPDDHKTEFSKVAAFTALAIGYLCPIRHKDPHRDSDVVDQLVNPMFGVRLAMQRVGADVESLTHEERDRLYLGFEGFSFPTLEKYYASLRSGDREIFDPFEIDFSAAEMIFIEDKITIFALCERLARVSAESGKP
jgi:hypothetical protein